MKDQMMNQNGQRSEQERLDGSHESDMRGEHRYGGAHQTRAEHKAREERDVLKQRLAGRIKTGPPTKTN